MGSDTDAGGCLLPPLPNPLLSLPHARPPPLYPVPSRDSNHEVLMSFPGREPGCGQTQAVQLGQVSRESQAGPRAPSRSRTKAVVQWARPAPDEAPQAFG